MLFELVVWFVSLLATHAAPAGNNGGNIHTAPKPADCTVQQSSDGGC